MESIEVADGSFSGAARLYHVLDWNTAPTYEKIVCEAISSRLVRDSQYVYKATECYLAEENAQRACLERSRDLLVVMRSDYNRIQQHVWGLENDPSKTWEILEGE